MVYDMIVVGAGAAGLFAGASLPARVNGLFLEKSATAGKKLLLSGSGQCNLTHGGDIADFVGRYGENGGKIRSILYRFNNRSVVEFFESRGLSLFEREDGKVFPVSRSAADVLRVLADACVSNGFVFRYSCAVTSIVPTADPEGPLFDVAAGGERFSARKLVVSTGGCSYPATGSDGSIFPVLEKLGIDIRPPKPALVPIFVSEYPYGELSGIALTDVAVTIEGNGSIAKKTGDLLLTRDCFSGPSILDVSRSAREGDRLCLDYIPSIRGDDLLRRLKEAAPGNKKQFVSVLAPETSVPKRFLEALCSRSGIDPEHTLSRLSLPALKAAVALLKRDAHAVSGTAGFNVAMATAGGVCLDGVNLKTLESKKYPGLYFAGEALDVDGDTGGYNLQFAFSSGKLAGEAGLVPAIRSA